MGGLRSSWSLCSQFSFRHFYHSGPLQQGCGPPQVRITIHTHTLQEGFPGVHVYVLRKTSSLFPCSADGTLLSLRTTQKAGGR